MLIMGIDPGIAVSGYGLVRETNNDSKTAVEYGVLKTDSNLSMAKRLEHIFNGYIELIKKFNPEAIAIEELFFNKNAKTIIAVGQARGAALLAASLMNVRVFEYTPLQVKQAVVGYGRADKLQIQEMTRIILGLKEIPRPDDAADALAVALCHINSSKFNSAIDNLY
ncbi:MAG: crossover junction endodeoxyribonuclease RuvC [Tepidanaerobacteraceae bacterium]|jgi:crossover junction endodeoxyribonuclease RuvC|nr:crossover junction endodeoxyribonuclease RuvC [Tepidanaerobacteraceae bacterium]